MLSYVFRFDRYKNSFVPKNITTTPNTATIDLFGIVLHIILIINWLQNFEIIVSASLKVIIDNDYFKIIRNLKFYKTFFSLIC